MNHVDAVLSSHGGLEYMGLAPFLRSSIAGEDFRPATQRMLDKLASEGLHANLLMNIAIAAQCLDEQELGLDFQRAALELERSYTLPAKVQPARLTLLVLVSEGSLQTYSPLECLLEVTDVSLVFHYVTPGEQMLASVPTHDVLFVGIADSDESRTLLQALAVELAHWPKPVLNAPQYLPFTGRDRASSLLQGIPRLVAPATQRVARQRLVELAEGQVTVAQVLPGADYPLILRPVGSQAGENLQRIVSAHDLSRFLDGLQEDSFFLAPFIDYSDERGLFKKIRIALIGGEPFVCHMAVSTDWMIHYVNAGMYAEGWKREEESRFMGDFAQFVHRHKAALDAISQRMKLEYLVMDCAETPSGDLLLFEIDHGGVVHAMDVESIFPYKNEHIHKAQKAFCELLYGLLAHENP